MEARVIKTAFRILQRKVCGLAEIRTRILQVLHLFSWAIPICVGKQQSKPILAWMLVSLITNLLLLLTITASIQQTFCCNCPYQVSLATAAFLLMQAK